MQKLNTFILSSTADNISKMSASEIRVLATLIADSKNAGQLCDFLSFAIQDKLISEIEVQDPVC
jgi:hypothetical protein